jgi:3-oxoacyl-[acyl-carrier protein] reductase
VPVDNVVVTGGSRGLGLGIVRQLAQTGYRVIAIARRESEDLAAAIEESREQPGDVRFLPFDLGKIDEIPKLVSDLRSQFGRLDSLVNNAAIGTSGILAITPDSMIEDLFRINVLSPIILSKYVVRAMMADGGGRRIVNIASVVANTGYSGLSAYSGTKAALIGFTRSLSRELGSLNITVNAVAPGFVDTEMTQGMGDIERRQIARRSALRRLPEAGDVAATVEFLLSERARNITGTVLTVDAGNTV